MGTDSADVEVQPHVLDYVRDHKVLTLATASATAMPRATTLAYVNDGVRLYVWTRPDTTTARHMDENPIVSFAIDDFTEDWRETKGIQGVGEPQVVLNP
jgi:nitroimidazol reductase NimA-like FMN-containing flavoprotein (pyridoxamine 5'-phosphate oxidase superfamily)